MKNKLTALAIGFACLTTAPMANAEELIGSYSAYIGHADMSNSKGAALSQPWQVLRQDRANYHRFNIRQHGDEGDRFFDSKRNRGVMERMIMRGGITKAARRIIMEGGATVYVRIYGHGSTGDRVKVTVSR